MKKRARNKEVNFQTKKESKMQLPLPIKLISIIYFIAAFFFFIAGIFILISAYYAINDPTLLLKIPGIDSNPSLIENLSKLGILISMGFIALSIIDFFSARGLLKKRRWAKNLILIISFFGTFNALIRVGYGFYSSILNLIFHITIAYYLIKNKNLFS